MERTLDAKGRWRNRTVGFRVSEEEAKMIDRMVALSGLTKQEYILRKLMNWEVTVQGNPRVYKALKNQMQQIYEELKRLEMCSEENEELLQTIQMVAVTLNGIRRNRTMWNPWNILKKENAPAGNKDISKAHTNLCSSGKAS